MSAHDGTLYVVTPRRDAILIDADNLATALHKKREVARGDHEED